MAKRSEDSLSLKYKKCVPTADVYIESRDRTHGRCPIYVMGLTRYWLWTEKALLGGEVATNICQCNIGKVAAMSKFTSIKILSPITY